MESQRGMAKWSLLIPTLGLDCEAQSEINRVTLLTFKTVLTSQRLGKSRKNDIWWGLKAFLLKEARKLGTFISLKGFGNYDFSRALGQKLGNTHLKGHSSRGWSPQVSVKVMIHAFLEDQDFKENF